MMKCTSAAANKLLKKLNEEKEYYLELETQGREYTAEIDEEPVIPNYDYEKNAEKIEAIDQKIVAIKHAINLNNALAKINVNGKVMSVDEILTRMAILNRRLLTLDQMRKCLPKTRVNGVSVRGAKPQYTYLNYDLDTVKRDYDKMSDEVTKMQLALDKYNQTYEFEIEGIE